MFLNMLSKSRYQFFNASQFCWSIFPNLNMTNWGISAGIVLSSEFLIAFAQTGFWRWRKTIFLDNFHAILSLLDTSGWSISLGVWQSVISVIISQYLLSILVDQTHYICSKTPILLINKPHTKPPSMRWCSHYTPSIITHNTAWNEQVSLIYFPGDLLISHFYKTSTSPGNIFWLLLRSWQRQSKRKLGTVCEFYWDCIHHYPQLNSGTSLSLSFPPIPMTTGKIPASHLPRKNTELPYAKKIMQWMTNQSCVVFYKWDSKTLGERQ